MFPSPAPLLTKKLIAYKLHERHMGRIYYGIVLVNSLYGDRWQAALCYKPDPAQCYELMNCAKVSDLRLMQCSSGIVYVSYQHPYVFSKECIGYCVNIDFRNE